MIKESILKTLVYADIFDFPLTLDELWQFLIADDISRKINKQEFYKILKSFLAKKGSQVAHFHNYYFLLGRKRVVAIRQRREKESKKKMIIAKRVVRFLSLIPTVKMIGVSGALAVENVKEKDDIDLFIITKRETIWITRFFILCILQLLRKRRRWGEKYANDKICVNMFMDESSLSLQSNRHDLYTAHEVVHLKVLFERDNMYRRFIIANVWIKKFLPNAIEIKYKNISLARYKPEHSHLFVVFMEKIAKVIQYRQIKKHQTKEIVSDTLLAFHPFDYREYTSQQYRKRCSTLIIKSNFDIMI